MKKILRLTYTQIIALGFFFIIIIGAILLSLPIASKSGEITPLVNSLFTAASATCVTGLVVYDTYSHWSVFGQIVILLLIQIGGLGFMTIATLFMLFLKKKIGLKQRGLMRESVNSIYIGGIIRLMRHILIGTFIAEGTGAVLLSFRFCPEMGLLRGIYYAIFHSVSAFCNAGFDLMGHFSKFSSLTRYSNYLLVNIVIMSLIVVGGIGFLVWEDIIEHRINFRRYQLHSKIVLSATFFLILCSAIIIFTLEYNGVLANMGTRESILCSLFHAITPRTAGFNTVDVASLCDSTVLFTIILMIIGGSPGSTAGGVKTTTFIVLMLATFSTIKNKSHLNIFKRRLPDDILRKACAIFMIYVITALSAIIIITFIDVFPLKDVFFEVFSAIGTVGMSLGITAKLNAVSKIILSFLMYSGRVGSLTIALAFAESRENVPVQLPVEKITIG